jgi:hypothetical protein
MRWNALIRKTVVSTLIGVLVLLAFMIGVLTLFFPQTMMRITYKMGMDKASVGFALTAYDRFGAVDYVGFAADTALKANMHERAEMCLERLLDDEDYDDYCERKNDDRKGDGVYTIFQAFYPRQLCLAIYWQGEGNRAIDRAAEFLDSGFAEGNPFIMVANRAMRDKDAGVQTLQYAYAKMDELAGGEAYLSYSAEDRLRFDQVHSAIGEKLP